MSMKKLVIFAAVGMLIASSCGDDGSDSSAQPSVEFAADDRLWPAENVSDWVTHASQISLVKVVSETEMPFESESGEGYQGRTVELKILETVWTDGRTEPTNGTIPFIANGWAVHGDVRSPFVAETGVRLEVGGVYLMPLTTVDDEWAVIGFGAILPVTDGRVAFDSALVEVDVTRLAAGEFVGLTIEDARVVFDREAALVAE